MYINKIEVKEINLKKRLSLVTVQITMLNLHKKPKTQIIILRMMPQNHMEAN